MSSEFANLNLKTLLEHAQFGVVIHRWDTSVVYANPTALQLLRLSYEQIIGKDSFDPQWNFLDDAGKKLLVEDYPVNKVKRTRGRVSNEIIGVIDSSREDVSWFMVNAYFEGDKNDDNNQFIIITFNDISDSKQLFSFRNIVENTQDIVVVTEADNIHYPTGPKIVYVNQAFEKLTGYRQEEVLGDTPRVLQGTLTDDAAKSRIHQALEQKKAITETLLNYDAKGRPYWIEMNIIPLENKYGEITHFAAIERDISEHKFQQEQLEKRNQDLKALKRDLEKIIQDRTIELQKAKAQLEKIAFFDPLTNIPNRRFFIDQANKLIKSCNRRGTMIAFGILDLDDFKSLNDNYGHDIGDAVLVKLADLLANFFRTDDAYCRFGGEEFAFAVAINQQDDALVLAQRLINVIREIRVDSGINGLLAITASLGIKAMLPEQDTDLEKELKQADIAMYQAKKLGKDKFYFANEPMPDNKNS